MNGRIYDPLLGRMLSADLVVQNPGSLQDFNRYSYVRNNPLTLTDPSGFCYQMYQEQDQIAQRQHAYAIGVGQQYDDGRFKAGVAITVGMVATVGTAGLAPEALAATGVGRILIAEVSGAVGGAASNMADNAMNGRPITENNSIAMTAGAVGGIAGQVLDEVATAAMRSSTATSLGAAQVDGPNPAVAPVAEAKPITPAPTETGAIQTTQPATAEIRGGRYGHLEDGPKVGSGKDYTATQKANILAENEKANGGVLRDDVTGEAAVREPQSQKGVTPPENGAQVDHYYPKSEGGPNSYSNAEVRLRKHNIKKSDQIPE